jgi:hypothetical protein
MLAYFENVGCRIDGALLEDVVNTSGETLS